MTIADNHKADSARRSQIVWIGAVALFGLIVFGAALGLLIQRFTKPAYLPVAKRAPHAAQIPVMPSRVVIPKSNRPDLTAIGNKPVDKTSAVAAPAASNLNSHSPMPVATSQPVVKSSPPEAPNSDPFGRLPRDQRNPKLAVLALPDVTEGIPPISWELPIDNLDEFNIVMLGSNVLLNKKLAEMELLSNDDPATPGKRVWSLQLKNNIESIVNELGEFRLSQGSDCSQLSFRWVPANVTHDEAQLVRCLAVGLSFGRSRIVCRLSELRPVSRLSCKFPNDKSFESAPSLDLHSRLLADLLIANGSRLIMKISLPEELRRDSAYDYGHLSDLRPNMKGGITIPIAVVPGSQEAAELEESHIDRSIAAITLQPIIADEALTLQITAKSNVALYDREQMAVLRKVALERGEFTAPKLIASGLSISEPIHEKLTEAAASAIAKTIQDTIKKLDRESLRRDGAINQVQRKSDKAKFRNFETPEKMLESLAKRQQNLASAIDEFRVQSERHQVGTFELLRALLLGGENLKDAGQSMRGIIDGATIGLTIGYECQFGNETYLIIIEEASE